MRSLAWRSVGSAGRCVPIQRMGSFRSAADSASSGIGAGRTYRSATRVSASSTLKLPGSCLPDPRGKATTAAQASQSAYRPSFHF
jgi:hypothetical protein